MSDPYKFLEHKENRRRKFIEQRRGVDPYRYHDLKCVENALTKLQLEEIHSCYKDDDEFIWRVQTTLKEMAPADEIHTENCNRTNEILKVFNPKFLLCCKNASVYAVCAGGNECICEIRCASCFKTAGGTKSMQTHSNFGFLKSASF